MGRTVGKAEGRRYFSGTFTGGARMLGEGVVSAHEEGGDIGVGDIEGNERVLFNPRATNTLAILP